MAPVEVSVLVPFRDSEDSIGNAIRCIAKVVHALGVPFELLAIDEQSRDNSVALLGLLRREIPELVVVAATARGRGFATGMQSARGRTVVLVEPSAATALDTHLRPFVDDVANGIAELAVADGRFAVGQAGVMGEAVCGVKPGDNFFGRLAAVCQRDGRNVKFHGRRGQLGRANGRAALRPWPRWFQGLPAMLGRQPLS